MANTTTDRADAWDIAARWCQAQGDDWTLLDQLGAGGTAPVFEVLSPCGPRALKIYDEKFSSGQLGDIEQQRIQQQLCLKNHDCSSLVQVYAGGTFDGRLFLLMSRAPGTELEHRLPELPRSSIRGILHDVATACLFLQSRDLCHRDIKAANVYVSDDFNHATLLDISVIRAIHDPIGIGTDHDGQLPVLATARYSPPEYLFRLIEPSPSLWHSLTIYQLGALLHDLITGIPLFQTEYQQSATNRYRFAWVVATQTPRIHVSDVDDDLILLANRALDKDWNRRSALNIEDFLDLEPMRQEHALQLLGMFRDPVVHARNDIQQYRMRLDQASSALEQHLIEYLRGGGVTATHRVSPGPTGDNSRTIELEWNTTDDARGTTNVELQYTVRLLVDGPANRFCVTAALTKRAAHMNKSATIELPEVPDDEHASATLIGQTEAAIGSLAIDASNADSVNT